MSEVSEHTTTEAGQRNPAQRLFDRVLGKQRLWLHITLFILTLYTTTIAGVHWRGLTDDAGNLANLPQGLTYALCILAFLTAHEFGHFIAARIHGVDATLPYYIPFPGSMYSQYNFG